MLQAIKAVLLCLAANPIGTLRPVLVALILILRPSSQFACHRLQSTHPNLTIPASHQHNTAVTLASQFAVGPGTVQTGRKVLRTCLCATSCVDQTYTLSESLISLAQELAYT
jgi:hypothetical protein